MMIHRIDESNFIKQPGLFGEIEQEASEVAYQGWTCPKAADKKDFLCQELARLN